MKQTTASIEAQKMDTLLSFKGKYNLLDTEDPAILGMPLGKGYTLMASIKAPWVIRFNDGIQTTEYTVADPKVPFTHSKDAISLEKKYTKACIAAGIEDDLQEILPEVAQIDIPYEEENNEPEYVEDLESKAREESEEHERRIIEMDLREKSQDQKPNSRYDINAVISKIDALLFSPNAKS